MKAIISLFKDKECKEELKKDNGVYYIDLETLSSKRVYTYTKSIYVKNTGNHKAYGLDLKTIDKNGINVSTVFYSSDLDINKSCKIDIIIEITKINKECKLLFKIDYDNLRK